MGQMDYRNEQDFQEETIDIKKYLFIVLRNWYWFVISLFIAWAAAWYINSFSEPVYNVGGATLMTRHERTRMDGMQAFLPGAELLSSRTTIQNQMEVLRSFSLNRRVINELDFDITYVATGSLRNYELYIYSPILVHTDDTRPNRTGYPVYVTILSESEYRLRIDERLEIDRIMQFGEQFEHEQFNFSISLVNNDYLHDEYYFVINSRDALANEYREKLDIEMNDPQTGSVLFLSTAGKVPRKEADYLNKLMEMFIRVDLEEKSQTAVNTIEFIDGQLVEISDSLYDAEKAMLSFQQNQNVTDLSREGTIIFSRLDRFQSQQSELVIKDKYFNYLLEYLTGTPEHKDIIAPSAIGIGDPLLSSLISQLNQLYGERSLLAFNVKEDNHRLLQLDRVIGNVTETLLENVRNMIHANRITLDDVNGRISEVEREISRLPLVERQILNLERRHSLSNNLYNILMEKRADASIAQAAQVSDNRILDYASGNATIIRPKTQRNYLIAIFLGFALPFMIILLADFLNTRITDRSYIDQNTNVPLLGSIGHNILKTEIPVEEKPKSAIAESFRALRTNLQYVLRDEGAKTISVTSTVSGEGKTFCTINLAAIIAMSGKKTLVLGLDLRRPKLNKIFAYDNEVGLSTYLIGKYSIEEIIQKTDIENLDIITSGAIPPNPAELLQSEKMEEFIEEVKSQYDYIVFDTPPVSVVSDALIVNRFADITIFVVRQNYSNKHVIDLINELYNKKEVKNINILLNDVRVPGYYGYGYGYYGYGYGHNYYQGYYGEESKPGFFTRMKQFLHL